MTDLPEARALSRDPRELNFDEAPADSEADTALRADIRRLGALLGQTLVRQEGQALLNLVDDARKALEQAGWFTGRQVRL